jgi:tetratricopeptide (TPR) repeat protein
MKKVFLFISLLFGMCSFPQGNQPSSPIDPLSYGVVLDDPGMKTVVVKKDITYLKDEKGGLNIDIYFPPNLKSNETRPAIIFLNAIGDVPGQSKVKSWGIYTTWPQLIAAQGYIGISMESDAGRIQQSIQELFKFIENKGLSYNIDKDKLGVYAASANVSRSSEYLMGKEAYKGIKAAVLYYGRPPVGPFRKDLAVLFLISEGDVNPGYNALWNEVLKNNAPWTIKMATGMPHAFDSYSDNDEARKVIKETISFWKNHLDPVPAPSWKYSKGRDVLGSLQMDHPKAVSLLKSLAEEYPRDVRTLLFYANELRQEKKFAEAGAVYKKVLTLEPGNLQALLDLAVLSYSLDNQEEAESYVSTAVNTGAMKRGDYARLGFYLLVANKNKEAAFYYEKAIALGSDSFNSYNLACAYAKMNDLENALRALKNSVKDGYGSKQQIESDTDFDLIRSDERFKEFLSTVK